MSMSIENWFSMVCKALNNIDIEISYKLVSPNWTLSACESLDGSPPLLMRFLKCRWAEWNGKYRDDLRRFIKVLPLDDNYLTQLDL